MQKLKILHQMTFDKGEQQNQIPEKPIKIRKKTVIEDFHLLMTKLTLGIDTTSIAEINDYSALKIITETSTNIDKFKNEKHFTSWLGLPPSAHQLNKKKRKKGRRHFNQEDMIFRQIAINMGNGKHTALSSFYKRIRARAPPRVQVLAPPQPGPSLKTFSEKIT